MFEFHPMLGYLAKSIQNAKKLYYIRLRVQSMGKPTEATWSHFAKCSGKQVKQVQAPNLHVMAQGALGKFKNKGTI